MKNTLIISMFGGPSSGKSTQAAGLFYRLKMRGFNCELITEKAKEFTWEDNQTALSHQLYVSGHQSYRQERVEGQVDIIITDSPTIIGLLYRQKDLSDPDDNFGKLLVNKFKSKNNINIVLNRLKTYQPIGRNQTEKEAKAIDRRTKKLLKDNDIEYTEFDPTPVGLIRIEAAVLERVSSKEEPTRQRVIDHFADWLKTTPLRKKFKALYISFEPVDPLSTSYQQYKMKICVDQFAKMYDDKLADEIITLCMDVRKKFDSVTGSIEHWITAPAPFKEIKKYHLYDDAEMLK